MKFDVFTLIKQLAAATCKSLLAAAASYNYLLAAAAAICKSLLLAAATISNYFNVTQSQTKNYQP